ncbi:hypothetical protein PUNSTDRAFT_50994 [Punctularia strigosozonata HHB-11173 SS5]|uniref:uncharacterized protein n=1 Tax=Punctularia strigosozonata (strain HHB-11173) TaxID=741275 RepID=UPI00044174FE|nr:uncharacterized protein PUNSTDRAFT_50994 [Punctularia strigosozonata HHB-11173 SS5]EIN10343.1 hypothetical protein PUNSTDRAFT_50994 [Punctularia strigosozonata HHB-11173 SS5]
MNTSKRKDIDEAYALQSRAAVVGGARYLFLGLGLATLGHYTWPAFRRQTLALKGFLVTGCAIFGMVMEQETALLAYESHRRKEESEIRRAARIDLGRRGIVPTETAIAKWKADREAAVAAAASAASDDSTTSS